MRWDWMKQTKAEREAYRNGLSLFFGALLGAHLGTLETLPLIQYAIFVCSLVGVVMALQAIGRARNRFYALYLIATFLILLALSYDRAVTDLANVTRSQIDRLYVMLAIWFGAVLIIEITPVVGGDRTPAVKSDLT